MCRNLTGHFVELEIENSLLTSKVKSKPLYFVSLPYLRILKPKYMKATEAKLLDFLKKSPQFVIPIYQRTYSWTEKECRQLWDDITRAGSNNDIPVHFVGSIVYIEQGLSQVTHQSPLLVIDGQQRLTTVTLFIAALANAIGDGEPADGFSAEMLRGYYLLNPLEKGERKFKLLLSLSLIHI